MPSNPKGIKVEGCIEKQIPADVDMKIVMEDDKKVVSIKKRKSTSTSSGRVSSKKTKKTTNKKKVSDAKKTREKERSDDWDFSDWEDETFAEGGDYAFGDADDEMYEGGDYGVTGASALMEEWDREVIIRTHFD